MSYCRFSCDDYQSDVYCYKYANGYAVHLASLHLNSQLQNKLLQQKDIGRHKIKRETSDLHFFNLDVFECHTLLDRLRSEGFHVPKHAFDALEKDIEKELHRQMEDAYQREMQEQVASEYADMALLQERIDEFENEMRNDALGLG